MSEADPQEFEIQKASLLHTGQAAPWHKGDSRVMLWILVHFRLHHLSVYIFMIFPIFAWSLNPILKLKNNHWHCDTVQWDETEE